MAGSNIIDDFIKNMLKHEKNNGKNKEDAIREIVDNFGYEESRVRTIADQVYGKLTSVASHPIIPPLSPQQSSQIQYFGSSDEFNYVAKLAKSKGMNLNADDIDRIVSVLKNKGFENKLNKDSRSKLTIHIDKLIRNRLWKFIPPLIALFLSFTVLSFISPLLWVPALLWFFITFLPSESEVLEIARKRVDARRIGPQLLLLAAMAKAAGKDEEARRYREQYEALFH